MSDIQIAPLKHAPALRDQVYDTLEQLIVTGQLAPGARLAEAELADRLGVSRNPVREALTVLAHAGWVDIKPRHGALVHQPTTKEREDFLAVRTLIKVEAARLAAIHAGPAQIAVLSALVAQGAAAAADAEPTEASELNSRFHEAVDQAADNIVLAEVLALMKKRLTWYFAPVARARGPQAWIELGALTRAIAHHDADAAATAMRDHCEHTAQACRATLMAGV